MKQRRVVDFFRGILFVSATLVALTLGSGFTFAQDGSVANGIVRDVDGEPIIGANVVEKAPQMVPLPILTVSSHSQ
ncbi:MAG: hypothetical protein IKO66_08050 [Paludibacteraceae bacterium]|nr:hypothetical protein [Paludibacteraceae bacterium]